MKRPAFQLYPGDWQRDIALRSCPVEARGLWFEMMCIMHQAEPYGHLILNGKGIGPEQLANIVGGITKAVVVKLLAKLELEAVFSRTLEGVIYSRRMVRDEATRNKRAAGGAAGAEHGAKGAEFGARGGRPAKSKGDEKPPLQGDLMGDKKPPLEPPPSSSSSSSSSEESKAEPRAARKAAITKPDDVAVAVWQDFTALRKAKKAPLTETALDGIREQAGQARMTLEAAMRMCCERGWQGFKAEWVAPGQRHNGPANPRAAAAQSIFGPEPDHNERVIDATATHVD